MKIEVVSPFTFKLVGVDATNFAMYTGNGTCDQVKVPIEHEFKSYADATADPLCAPDYMLPIPDLGKFGRSDQLHMAIRAIWQYQSQNGGQLPKMNDATDAEAVWTFA